MVSQLQALNKILSTKDFSLVTLNNLTEDYFFNYKTEFNYIKTHFSVNHTVPDLLTFVNVFKSFTVQEVNEPNSYLLEQLFKDYNAAYLVSRFNAMKDLLENDKIEDAVEYFKKSVDNLRVGGAVNCVDLTQNTDRFTHYLEMQKNMSKYFISTGFLELDKVIYGIDTVNENMVIAARTGVGKSWMLLKMAATAARHGKTVGIYSGEMSVDKVGYRIDTILGKLPNRAITHGDLVAKNAYSDYINSLPHMKLGAIKVITPRDISGPPTVDALRAFVEKEHIEVLFIDQYSLLDDVSKTHIMHEKVANISKAIKRLQVEKQIPIISVAQMNRTKNEDKEGNKVQDTTQIGLSDRIGQDATCIIMLDRNQVKDKLDASKPVQDQLILNIVKSRDGGDNRKLTYSADFDAGEFIFIPESMSNDEAKAYQEAYSDTPVI